MGFFFANQYFSLQISIFLYNMPMTVKIHPSWKEALKDEFEKPYW